MTLILQKIVKLTWRLLPRGGRRLAARVTQPNFTISSGAVVFDWQNRVLLLDHVLRVGSGWGLPTGFIKAREQLEAGARREIFEETNLHIKNLTFLHARTLDYPHLEFWFVAEAAGEPLAKSREIFQAQWFELDRMPPELSVSHRRLIEKARLIREKNKNLS